VSTSLEPSELSETKPKTMCSGALGTCVAEDSFVWPQWERMCIILWKPDGPGKRDVSGVEVGVVAQLWGHPEGVGNEGWDQVGLVIGWPFLKWGPRLSTGGRISLLSHLLNLMLACI